MAYDIDADAAVTDLVIAALAIASQGQAGNSDIRCLRMAAGAFLAQYPDPRQVGMRLVVRPDCVSREDLPKIAEVSHALESVETALRLIQPDRVPCRAELRCYGKGMGVEEMRLDVDVEIARDILTHRTRYHVRELARMGVQA
jgi:hypothetical protein